MLSPQRKLSQLMMPNLRRKSLRRLTMIRLTMARQRPVPPLVRRRLSLDNQADMQTWLAKALPELKEPAKAPFLQAIHAAIMQPTAAYASLLDQLDLEIKKVKLACSRANKGGDCKSCQGRGDENAGQEQARRGADVKAFNHRESGGACDGKARTVKGCVRRAALPARAAQKRAEATFGRRSE